MPENIGYTILECSGEEAENPCSELLAHTQDSKGWTTPRNGTFPQHITLQLDHRARLQHVQLLSHEYKIAGKIELQVACSTKDKETQEFSRLGFLSFDPNDRTNFSARELKSVTLPDVEATAVKLVIHRCHANMMNTHSQACLIMLNLVGEPLVSSVDSTATATTTATVAPVVVVAAPAVVHTINPTITHRVTIDEEDVDQVTAQRIAELQEKKAAAVAIEDYDEAKRLKSAIERLRAAGAKMAALEARKKAAVDAEDYDAAKAIKIELEKMRHRAYAAIAKGDHYDAVDHERILSPVQQQAGAAAAALSNDIIMNTSATTAAAAAASPFSPALSSIDSYDGSRDNGAVLNTTTSPMTGSRSAFIQKPTTSGGSSDWRSYDERRARAAGAYDLTNFEDLNADSAPPGAVVRTTTAGRGGTAGGVAGSPGGVNGPLRRIDENADHGGSNHPARVLAAAGVGGETVETGERAAPEPPCPPAPPGFPSELPLPEPLSLDDAKESGPMEAVVGEFLTRCLYSKSWQLREAGITAIATAAGTSSPDALPRLDGDGDALRLLCGIVAQGLKARIPAIVAASLVLLRALVRSAAARQLAPRDVHAALSELLPIVAERACDTAPRAREQAVEALVDIAKVKESGLKSLTGIFLRSYKVTESPKITQGRLHLLSALLPVLGVVPSNSNNLTSPLVDSTSSPSPSSSSAAGFSAEAVVLFCCPALKSANAEVRSAAAELVVKVGRAPGVGADVVLPLLPVDANPKLKQQLEEDLTGQKKITTTRGTSTAAAVRPRSTGKANGGKAGNTSAAPSNTRSKSASTSEPSSRRTSNTTTNSGGAAGQASNTSTKTGNNSNQQERRPSQRSSMPPQQQQTPLQTPTYYQQHQQQALYQPSPSLPLPPAEDPSTIMYTPSVVGPEFSVADEDPAPFEEELRRREATLGPSHPSVAEAASNLAIIYNQRGDGARALPLYQRALNIWEMTHGPHHPDVAHALTDIAVILLEAGHDAQGKQLLQRALGIQMELLGPNHPDVVAIKDVLDED